MMGNAVTLHGDKRWKAAIDCCGNKGVESVEHWFEEISDLRPITERGPEWNRLGRCVVTLSRSGDGEEQNSAEKALRQERKR